MINATHEDFFKILQEQKEQKELEKQQMIEYFKGKFSNNIPELLFYEGYRYSQDKCEIIYENKIDCTDRYIEEIYKKFGNERVWTNNEISTFKELLISLQSINQEIKPVLDALGLAYEVTLTGGAIRDFLLKVDSIKDLDVIINIEKPFFNEIKILAAKKSQYNQEKNKKEEDCFTEYYEKIYPKLAKFELDRFNFDPNLGEKVDQFYSYIVKEMLARKFKITNIFNSNKCGVIENIEKDHEMINQADYHNVFLQNVIKINDKKFNYPVDILLSTIKSEQYNECFDFNICKVSLPLLSNDKDNQLINNELSVENTIKFINKIRYTEGFLIDAIYQKLTLNIENFTLVELERSLTKHYPKLNDKYPTYELSLPKYMVEDMENVTYEEYAKMLLADVLRTKKINKAIDKQAEQFLITHFNYYQLEKIVLPKSKETPVKKSLSRKI